MELHDFSAVFREKYEKSSKNQMHSGGPGSGPLLQVLGKHEHQSLSPH